MEARRKCDGRYMKVAYCGRKQSLPVYVVYMLSDFRYQWDAEYDVTEADVTVATATKRRRVVRSAAASEIALTPAVDRQGGVFVTFLTNRLHFFPL